MAKVKRYPTTFLNDAGSPQFELDGTDGLALLRDAGILIIALVVAGIVEFVAVRAFPDAPAAQIMVFLGSQFTAYMLVKAAWKCLTETRRAGKW